MTLTDGLGRTVNYLRLSVTDRCNLQCMYCSRRAATSFIPHENILTYEEMLTLVDVARSLGVAKVRLTGGEPFVRRDFLAFLGMLRAQHPDLDLRVTTNGTLLRGKIPALKLLGVHTLNISLDTMDPVRFREITGRDFLPRVLDAVAECLDHGLRVKINCVAVKGVNDDELPAFLDLAARLPLEVRFIEYMPMGGCLEWTQGRLWRADEILEAASRLATLTPLVGPAGPRGPSRMFAIAGGAGKLGLISPMSGHFCDTCNRLRITSDGGLRTCLYSEHTYRLRGALRSPRLSPDTLARIIRRALASKPLGYRLLEARQKGAAARDLAMSSIGG